MHTIQLQLEDSLYNKMKNNGIDINAQFQEYLLDFINDGYPTIDTDEATQRVSNALTDYETNGLKNFEASDDSFWDNTESRLQERQTKA